MPVIGDYVPLNLNAVYFIILGPIIGTVMAAYISYLCGRERPEGPAVIPRNTGIFGVAIAFLVGVSVALSVQYFLILAPKELCSTTPHYDFLWISHPGPVQIAHCFSGTDEINSQAPYYLEPQIVQSWGHVLWPLLTAVFLWRAWLSLRSHAVVARVIA
ncbi:hypothetical protein RU07_11745 [Agrobacterium tumefaciens]|uniref:Uncharacterized protein n=1 Tax=Agrobacterium tumefaciens TaxID=358 RepID=A0A0D0KYQ3_AGRTU|nr:hypothetical protein RU07_11745 [Agrobacterium tumefaciens]